MNRKKRKKIFCIMLFACIALLSSCQRESKTEFFAMDTVMNISAYGKNAENAVSQAKSEILRIASELDRKNEFGVLYKLNKSKSSDNSELFNILQRSVDICDDTNGCLDITTEPLSAVWGFYDQNYRIPNDDEITDVLKYVGYRNISFSDSQIFLKNNVNADMGAVAKGYAADCAAEILKGNGITSALISLGGNVRTIGKKTDGTNWKIGIQNPNDTSNSIAVIEASDVSVVTSGSYQRYFENNGKRYHHILNPKTGFPADSGLLSATVVTSDGLLADSLSTAFFVMGLENAKEYLAAHPNIGAIFVTTDGTLHYTNNLKIQSFAEKNIKIEE